MNIRQLKTMVAVAECRTFTEAGQQLGLSHSAVSLHVKALEDELNVVLVDRSVRPPALTDRGRALVSRARRMVGLVDEIRALGSDEQLVGRLEVGVVPSVLVHLLPPALAAIRERHPDMEVGVKVALSGDLANALKAGEIDAAIATEPDTEIDGLRQTAIGSEPLVMIAPADLPPVSFGPQLCEHPFIWFSRKTWAGRQIERRLLDRGLVVSAVAEVESLDAVTAFVRHGLGISIVPVPLGAPPLPDDIRAVPLGGPGAVRRLTLLERYGSPKSMLSHELAARLRRFAQDWEGGVRGPGSAGGIGTARS